MSVLGWIVGMSLAGGVLSVSAAAIVSFKAKTHWVSLLISYAIGALLGASFLEILPHAITASGDALSTLATVLGGILVFFVLEKLVLWRHCHIEDCEGHEPHVHGHDHGRTGLLIMVGDTFHNAVDGVLIAAAFMEDIRLGIITALAMIAHEIPQEVGDFMILLHSGYSKARALTFNLLSSLATLLGALLAYAALGKMQTAVPVLLALAAASMIYVAVADLIPGLHKRTELKATVQQILLIGAGIASIVLTDRIVSRFWA
uniref:ZIP zinc transporter n=1 Tax=uncultured bacterium P11N2 TaxID=1748282 RepID=A0A0U3KDK5_9BACT|nr:ZIP zinc transporter [uncultured bacterium P11N2]